MSIITQATCEHIVIRYSWCGYVRVYIYILKSPTHPMALPILLSLYSWLEICGHRYDFIVRHSFYPSHEDYFDRESAWLRLNTKTYMYCLLNCKTTFLKYLTSAYYRWSQTYQLWLLKGKNPDLNGASIWLYGKDWKV